MRLEYKYYKFNNVRNLQINKNKINNFNVIKCNATLSSVIVCVF